MRKRVTRKQALELFEEVAKRGGETLEQLLKRFKERYPDKTPEQYVQEIQDLRQFLLRQARSWKRQRGLST